MPDISVLDVLLHGERIGTLTLVEGSRTLFAFNKTYIDNPERPLLSLSFKDQLGQLLTDVPPTNARVPPFFPTFCRRVCCARFWLSGLE